MPFVRRSASAFPRLPPSGFLRVRSRLLLLFLAVRLSRSSRPPPSRALAVRVLVLSLWQLRSRVSSTVSRCYIPLVLSCIRWSPVTPKGPCPQVVRGVIPAGCVRSCHRAQIPSLHNPTSVHCSLTHRRGRPQLMPHLSPHKSG